MCTQSAAKLTLIHFLFVYILYTQCSYKKNSVSPRPMIEHLADDLKVKSRKYLWGHSEIRFYFLVLVQTVMVFVFKLGNSFPRQHFSIRLYTLELYGYGSHPLARLRGGPPDEAHHHYYYYY